MEPKDVLFLLQHEGVLELRQLYVGRDAQVTENLRIRATELFERGVGFMYLSKDEQELCDIWRKAEQEASAQEAVNAKDRARQRKSLGDTLAADSDKRARIQTTEDLLDSLEDETTSIMRPQTLHGPWLIPRRYSLLTQVAQTGQQISNHILLAQCPPEQKPTMTGHTHAIASWKKDLEGYYSNRLRGIYAPVMGVINMGVDLENRGHDETGQQLDVRPTEPRQHARPIKRSRQKEDVFQTLLQRRRDLSLYQPPAWYGQRDKRAMAPRSASDLEAEWCEVGLPRPAEFGFSMQTILFAYCNTYGVVFDPTNPLEYSLFDTENPHNKAVESGEMKDFYKRCAAIVYWLDNQKDKLPTHLLTKSLLKGRRPSSSHKFPGADEVESFIREINTTIASEDFFNCDAESLLPFVLDVHAHKFLLRRNYRAILRGDSSLKHGNDEKELEEI